MKKSFAARMTILATGFMLAAAIAVVGARQQANAAAAQAAANRVVVDPDDIGGVVNGPNGPEAGVWVIAETTDTPTKYHKIVVTDDQGQFVVPDLPRANYKVWVRGYGLVDSAPVQANPGSRLALTAVQAPSPRAAAQYYPANYWYSLINVPPAKDFPGTGDSGNGIAPEMLTQANFVSGIKASCNVCHQLGNKATRELLPALGTFPNSVAAWDRRVQSGQDGAGMSRSVSSLGRQRALAMFADWTDRIAAGAVPVAPPRPQGLERNVVVTGWDWGVPATFAHDEVTTDKRNPTLNANGPFYGADYGTDRLLIVDPLEHKASFVKLPVKGNVPSAKPQTMQAPSPYWGDEIYWTDPAHPHNPMMDQLGRVWSTQGTRAREDQPAFCKDPNNPFAKLVPIPQGGAGVSLYDPKTGKVELIDTCFGTHHLNFAEDKDNTLYFSGDGNVVGWLNTRVYDETKDISKAEGWCPLIVDYNGDGKAGAYTLPNEPADPMLDRRVPGGSYSLVPSPIEKAVWFATPGTPGRIVRLEIGANPPATCKAEVYNPPFDPKGKIGYTPRGIDIDRNGVVWTGLASSGHYASFDRRKCKVLNGPTAMGQQCQEGWTLYRAPGPSMGGVEHENSTDFFYTNFVDQFDTLGLGRNVPIANGTASDSLLVLLNGQWIVMRVPYPMGFYSRGLDGRIDDVNAGWKGRGVYADYGPNAVWHLEGGKGTLSEIVKFQVRPNPLAK
jgi:hypothetical protein